MLDGDSSITLEEDAEGLIWFTDIKSSTIGSLNPNSGMVQTFKTPKLYPLTQNNFPISLESYDGKIWVTVINKNAILKFDPKSESWEEFILPTENSGPCFTFVHKTKYYHPIQMLKIVPMTGL